MSGITISTLFEFNGGSSYGFTVKKTCIMLSDEKKVELPRRVPSHRVAKASTY